MSVERQHHIFVETWSDSNELLPKVQMLVTLLIIHCLKYRMG